MRLISILSSLMLVITLLGCTQKEHPAASKPMVESKTVLTSFYPLYIIAKNVAHDVPGITVKNMTSPQTGCLHEYQMTPEDMKTLSTASYFVVNGAGMESFLDKVLAEYPRVKVIVASENIKPAVTEKCDNHEEHDAEHHDEHVGNPHFWVSVSHYMTQVKSVCDGLVKADPANEKQYRANAEAYLAKLEALKTRMHAGLDSLPSRNIITFHEAFPYFAEEFKFNIVSVIEREPGSAPSAGELAETVAMVKKHKVKALFAEPQYPAKAAETIARETGIKLYTLDPIVSGPDSRDAYIQIMDKNCATLLEALH